ncbi:MAG: host specificity factor TipJ family phage tail protein [Defluviicoccus sp.]|nr:host specificity factor TipJ family phage tail protein [Defluviicoccus sp.]MDG4610314.1 host specificity factor TipJ family phage tail protein [Defluviicoccus sp.]
MPPDQLPTKVSACPHPFSARRADYTVPAGLTLAQIIDIIQPDPILSAHGIAFIGAHAIPRQHWARVRPKEGALVSIRLLPSGGGNGRIAAMIGIAVLAIVVSVVSYGALTGPAIGMSATLAGGIAGAAGAAVSLGGTLLLNTFLPPPLPELSRDAGTEKPSYAITGARNRVDPWGKVPFLLGRFNLTPPYAAVPWREIVRGSVYWRALFAIAHGPIAIEQMRIGETPLENFREVETEFRRGYWSLTDRGGWNANDGVFPSDPAFSDTWTVMTAGTTAGVSFKAGETITFNGVADAASADAWDRNQGKPFRLYPKDVYEEALSVAVKAATPAVRASQAGADELAIELVFERGLVHIENEPAGRKKEKSVTVKIEQSPAGQNEWTDVLTTTITGKQTTPLYWGHRWQTGDHGTPDPLQKYDIRVSNHSGDADEKRSFGNFSWIALRTITAGNPVPVPAVAMLAVRIRSTGQLQGMLAEFNLIARTIARDWDEVSSTWVWRPTSSPAALFRHVLQHPARVQPAPDQRIDLGRLAWWDSLTRPGTRDFNGVIEAKGSLYDALVKIARVGRALPCRRDLQVSVAIDEPKTAPVRLFSPRNSWDYQGEISHEPSPHGYRIGYVDATRDWRADEVVVYDDGFDAATATRIERVEWPGIISRDQAWKEGRYHLAQQRLRREVHRLSVDFEHLACERGDLVALQHDVIAVGLGSARIVGVSDDGSRALTVSLDTPMPMEAAKAYGFRARRVVAGAMRTDLYAIETQAGPQATLAFSDPPPLTDAPAAGDLISFGEWERESIRVLVRDIEPRADLSARLTLIAEAAGVHVAEQGPIPPYDPVVTRPRTLPAPVVKKIRSDTTVMLVTLTRTLVDRVVFSLAPIAIEGAGMSVLYRPAGSDAPWTEASIQDQTNTMVAIAGVTSGESYDFRLQRWHPDYFSSPVTEINSYAVTGREAPPAALQNLSLGIVGGQALLRWDLPADLDVQYGGWILIRHSPLMTGASWPNTTSIARTVMGDQTHLTLPLKAGTYLARVYDSGGRGSPVAAVTSKQASVLQFTPAGALVADPTFAGTKDTCEVVSGGLQLANLTFDAVAATDALDDWDQDSTGIAPAGVYHFAAGMDFGAVKRLRLTSHLNLVAINPLDTIDDRTVNIDAWPDIDATDQAAGDASVWGRLTDDDPASAPTWGPPIRIDATEITARAVGQLECRLTTSDNAFNARITELSLIAEEVA